MPNLVWTRERPREPGWYWWRYSKSRPGRMIRVQKTKMRKWDLWYPVFGEWAGPITQPEEPRG